MTRPRADSEGWLTDPISRDRTIAKTVVEGIHQIITLLRGIRADLDESKALREDIRRLEGRLRDIEVEFAAQRPSGPLRGRRLDYESCPKPGCGLPSGHTDAHRPRVGAI